MQPSDSSGSSSRKTTVEMPEKTLAAKSSSSLSLRRHNATACTQSDVSSPQHSSSSSPRSSTLIAENTNAETSTSNVNTNPLSSSSVIVAECSTNGKNEQSEKLQVLKLTSQSAYSLYETFLMIDDKTGRPSEYMLDGKLGTGGFSSVFLVHNVENDQQCAMKAVRIDIDLELKPQFLFEIEVTDKELLLVLELGTEAFIDHLCRYQRHRTDVEHSFLRKNFVQMVRAVQFIHRHDILHCDIKGDNFVFTNGERLKLVDFGCATPLGVLNHGVIRKRRLGTKHYMPPEYMRDNYVSFKLDPKHLLQATKSLDVWSLGCILYDMIHERTPFESEANIRQAVITRKPDLSHISCHSELVFLFRSMFEQDYKQRITCQGILHNTYVRRQMDDPPTIAMPRRSLKPANEKTKNVKSR